MKLMIGVAGMVAAVSLIDPSLAQVIELTKRIELPHYTTPFKLDIVGIRPGDDADRVRTALIEHMGTRPSERDLQIGVGRTETARFVARMEVDRRHDDGMNERMRVVFASPTGGSQAIAIYRRLAYAGMKVRGPAMADIVAGLKQKYGEPLQRNERPTFRDYKWFFSQGQPARCEPVCQQTWYDDYNPANFRKMAEQGTWPFDVAIHATIHGRDERMSELHVTIVDVGRRAKTIQADLQVLEGESAKVRQSTVSTPKL